MNIEIRKESPTDFPDVFELNCMAFGQDIEANLVRALRDSDAFIPQLSLVATNDKKIVGHILFTKIAIKEDNGNIHESLALAPIAVRPEWQNRGIGGELIRKGFSVAKDLGFKSVIVLGHENYYPKFGFVPCEKWNIKAPFDVPANVFMGIELVREGLKNVSGTVVYSKEFDSL